MTELYCVRSVVVEEGEERHLDEGPWEHSLAELVLADIGVDATIPRGIGRVDVLRARLTEPDGVAPYFPKAYPHTATDHRCDPPPWSRALLLELCPAWCEREGVAA